MVNEPVQPEDKEVSAATAVTPRYALHWSHTIGALILCGIGLILSLTPLWHTDLWGHVQYGRWILEHQAFPEHEPFTPYSDPSQTLVQSQWLSQVIYGELFDLGGQLAGENSEPVRKLAVRAELLLTLHLLVMVAMYLFLWLAYRRVGGSIGWANLAILMLVFGILSVSRYQRPQMLGMLCFAILIWVLSKPLLSRGAMIGVPIVLVLWANLHGSFVVGMAMLGLFVVARFVELRCGDWSRRWRAVVLDARVLRPAIAGLAAIIAVGILNPHGPRLYYLVATFGSRPNLHLLNEWQRIGLRLGEDGFWPFAVSLGVVLVLWIASRGARSALLIVALPFACLPLMQQRMMTWWLPLAGWLVAALGSAAFERLGVRKLLPKIPPSPIATVFCGIFAVLGLAFLPPLQWLIQGHPRPLNQSLTHATCWELGMELNATPAQRGRWLPKFAEAMRDYPDNRFRGGIFTSETLGDYLLVVAPPDSPVLIYTHAHLFSAAYFEQCMEVKWAHGDWQNWLAERHVNLIAIEPDRHADLAIILRRHRDWIIVQDDGAAPGNRRIGDRKLIAVRKKPL